MDDNRAKLEKMLEEDEATSKHDAKASVFTDLFSDPKYTYQLYQALHPEDKETVEEDLLLMTIKSKLVNQQYNDLGFLVGDRLIILIEHQSTWSKNIVLRVLLYVVETWNKYIKQMQVDVYGDDDIRLPKPELYVIYAGPHAGNKPSELSLREVFFDGADVDVDCKVKIITDGKKGDIISQFVRFCKVFNAQIKTYGKTRKAVEETIRICRDENVLKEYLERQWEEVINMYMTLFDDETITRNHEASLERKAEARGIEKGEIRGAIRIYNDELGLTPTQIIQKIMDRFDLEKEEAEKYVEETLDLQMA